MDKFIWAMAVFAAILALVIGGGFTALEYLKQSPYTVKQYGNKGFRRPYGIVGRLKT